MFSIHCTHLDLFPAKTASSGLWSVYATAYGTWHLSVNSAGPRLSFPTSEFTCPWKFQWMVSPDTWRLKSGYQWQYLHSLPLSHNTACSQWPGWLQTCSTNFDWFLPVGWARRPFSICRLLLASVMISGFSPGPQCPQCTVESPFPGRCQLFPSACSPRPPAHRTPVRPPGLSFIPRPQQSHPCAFPMLC